jgi:hypothetical protein
MLIWFLPCMTGTCCCSPAASAVVAELPTAGCFGIYASPVDQSVFSTLCGDGTAVTIGIDATGKERFRHRSARFFDAVNDPVYIEAGRLGAQLVLLSFKGTVHILDMSGDTVVQTAVWSLTGPDDTRGWAPGGYQPFAVHAATGQISLAITQDASPVLFALNRDDATLRAFTVDEDFRVRGRSAPVVESASTMKLP